MKSWERATSSAVIGVVVFLLSASSSGAAVVLTFSPSAAAVGERVTGASEEGGVPIPEGTNLEIFLADSQRIADRARGPHDPRLERFGVLRVDDEGAGRFDGTVPDVDPGHYVAVAYCRSCTGDGSTFTVGDFTVSRATLPTTGSSPFGLVSLALVILGAGLLFARFGSPPRLARNSSA